MSRPEDFDSDPKSLKRRRYLTWGAIAVAAVILIAVVSALTGESVTSSRIQAGYTGVRVPGFALSAVRGESVESPG